MASISGTIKRLVSDKGFGFVQAGDGAEYFFHLSDCVDARFDELREGQTVTFDKGQGRRARAQRKSGWPEVAVPSTTTREVVPPLFCPVCRSPDPVAASKTIDASTYWRCSQCGEVWNVGRRRARADTGMPPKRAW